MASTEPNHCAQLVRETIEANVVQPWPVAEAAHEFRKARSGVVRWAVDYLSAALLLELGKPASTPLAVGDVLFWRPHPDGRDGPWGHVALYAGEVNGEAYVLESNGWGMDKRPAPPQGARRLLGDRTWAFATPLRAFGTPDLVAYPTAEVRDAERVVVAQQPVAPAPGAVAVPLNEGPRSGIRLMDQGGQLVTFGPDSQEFVEGIYNGTYFRRERGGHVTLMREAQYRQLLAEGKIL